MKAASVWRSTWKIDTDRKRVRQMFATRVLYYRKNIRISFSFSGVYF